MSHQPSVEKILEGDIRAAARLVRDIDDGMPGAVDALKALYPRTGRAHVVGVTGAPGTGKSTICDRLIGSFRAEGKKVGVVAVDPSSPYSGGAILGDRIRMQEHATDPGVFIRSMATRGHLGGLSASTGDVVRVMDAMGMDVVIVETVGVGQDEIEVARTAHTTVVVLVPGMGDDVQAIKAGLLEIADCFAVNKSDRDGADKVVRELQVMLDMRPRREGDWEPPVVKTAAIHGEGIGDLRGALDRHAEWAAGSGRSGQVLTDRRKSELGEIMRGMIAKAVERRIEAYPGGIDGLANDVRAAGKDPYTAAEEILKGAMDGLKESGGR
ncbi:MAG: methylmalonyl Co-A mutase-associated GTPase MeaB [Deltaproteobacteria bacterium]|nr:methylmalonyl Co-A mutase-associated GTPase MeaB [Deltaproteobacteria bacterium]